MSLKNAVQNPTGIYLVLVLQRTPYVIRPKFPPRKSKEESSQELKENKLELLSVVSSTANQSCNASRKRSRLVELARCEKSSTVCCDRLPVKKSRELLSLWVKQNVNRLLAAGARLRLLHKAMRGCRHLGP